MPGEITVPSRDLAVDASFAGAGQQSAVACLGAHFITAFMSQRGIEEQQPGIVGKQLPTGLKNVHRRVGLIQFAVTLGQQQMRFRQDRVARLANAQAVSQ